ncbi:hypothetical protein [Bacillus phage Megatron]|uniref:Uncharacterized protein n=2 Tax=Wphvirus megatron TaxID=1987728 RepID=A0A024B2T4_9CAUD|nr:hypothetical protein FP75_gp095 [Bacillus phage Megatron]YP_009280902.1 hypothetical protein SAGEFAYGE_99 [Bacillus phage SageFayge]AHZ10677.1 hypothetical protein [Bacillus phage Megatron]AMW63019.1 hypothetical protein SAGEFAYGE_99 [Bacillus phage SageFayge]
MQHKKIGFNLEVEEFTPDPTLKAYADMMHEHVHQATIKICKEMDDAIKKEIEKGLEGYEYDTYTVEKPHPSLPALITLYPSRKEILLFGVNEHKPDLINFKQTEIFKIRMFDGYDEIFKSTTVFYKDYNISII